MKICYVIDDSHKGVMSIIESWLANQTDKRDCSSKAGPESQLIECWKIDPDFGAWENRRFDLSS